MTLLSVRHLNKSFGGHHVVADVSFNVAAGEIVALIGPNGAGKSTCFNILSGQMRPDSGEVRVGGVSIKGWRPDRIWRLGVGRGFQIAAVFQSMTVRDNIRTALTAGHADVWRWFRPAVGMYAAEVEGLLALTGLADLADVGCGSLAYGDLKRLELALALTGNPKLLLVDEPTSGMTSADRCGVMQLLANLARGSGCAVLLTEHDTDAVFRVADRILVMDKGVVIADGDAALIRADRRVREAYLGVDLSSGLAG